MNLKMLKTTLAGLVLSVCCFANAGLISIDETQLIDAQSVYDEGILLTSFGDVLLQSNQSMSNQYDIRFDVLSTSNILIFELADVNDINYIIIMQQNNGVDLYDNTLVSNINGLGEIELAFYFENSLSNFYISMRSWFQTPKLDDLYINSGITIENVRFGHYEFAAQNNNSTNVPEPSTLAIFVLGIVGLVSRRFNI